jgi:hypothetical protein
MEDNSKNTEDSFSFKDGLFVVVALVIILAVAFWGSMIFFAKLNFDSSLHFNPNNNVYKLSFSTISPSTSYVKIGNNYDKLTNAEYYKDPYKYSNQIFKDKNGLLYIINECGTNVQMVDQNGLPKKESNKYSYKIDVVNMGIINDPVVGRIQAYKIIDLDTKVQYLYTSGDGDYNSSSSITIIKSTDNKPLIYK